jgi:hypothetical protein
MPKSSAKRHGRQIAEWIASRVASVKHGRELFPPKPISPRERILRQIKTGVTRLAMLERRENFKLAARIFAAVPELRRR